MKVYHSSKTDEWATPDHLFCELHKKFNFTLDPCATPLNHKLPKYYTKKDDGLGKDWTGERVFCNPPYSQLGKWLAKAKNHDAVCLVPARTDTKAFHEHVFGVGEVVFLKGRLKFGDSKNSAPFPSCLIYYGKLKPRKGEVQ